ncbi:MULTISPECIES: hypothetical protein [Achromobacter]|uniref:COG3904 family protein n=1 Tax=Achromobacter TaxID=222 RepID=UPI0006C26AB4|nr:hypothetical protein [Achromobacter dolens]MCZ8407412.1 hypothetical protein [Achromobacter dolens]CAB3903798.1 hypothetical protein LMG26842_05500 [Achromobacter dolens]CUI31571.1 Uncharacterised protein [Achromobacter dolens]
MLKRKLTMLAAGLALSMAGVSAAVAQTQAPAAQQEEPERYGPFFFLPSQPNLLVYVGAVGANDMLNLKKALREHPTISTLILQNNGGGLVHIGLVVAEEVYERGLNTYIPKDSYCASACSFVFFAGRQRLAEGRLGVHQISAPEMTGEQAQFGVSDIVATLPKYGVSADVLGIMFSTPSKEMYFFSPQEIIKYGINRTGNVRTASNDVQPGTGQRAAPATAPAAAPAPQAQSPGDAKLPPRKPASPDAAPAPAGPVANPYMPKETAPAAITDEQKAINAAALMIQAGSGTNEEALKFTREFYADSVDYFKKQRPKSEILADKEAYFARWPVRRFVVDQSSLRAKCQDQMCMVKGLYDYKVSSPERGKTATGTSNFTYVLDLRNRYRIVMEDSEVISR